MEEISKEVQPLIKVTETTKREQNTKKFKEIPAGKNKGPLVKNDLNKKNTQTKPAVVRKPSLKENSQSGTNSTKNSESLIKEKTEHK